MRDAKSKILSFFQEILLVLFCLFLNQTLQAAQPIARDGVLDLHGWDFAKNGVVELNGQWEFYPSKYYDPEDFLSSNLLGSEYVKVPGSWTDYAVGKGKMPVFGYATYRLTIVLDSKKWRGTKELAFEMPNVYSAYRLWIDTALVMTVGVPGTNTMMNRPKIVPVTIPLFAQSDTVVITIQVANFFFPQFGGIDRPIKLGLNTEIVEDLWLKNIAYIVGAVFALALGIYFFFLSPIPRERNVNILFAITCLFVVLRYLFERTLVIMLFFPDFDPALRQKLLFVSMDYFPLILWTALSFFPDMIPKKVVQSAVILFALYSVVLLITPLHMGGQLNLYFVVLSIIISFYVTVVAGIAYKRKRESAGIFFYGAMFSTIIFAGNMYFTFVHSADQYYIPIESVVYLTLAASAITRRMVHSREREIQLSSDLQIMNRNLEHLVEGRTRDLNVANESLKKLNASKDRFISILSHDLRNPLYNLIGLSRRLMRSAASFDKKKVKDYAEVINESAVAGHKLVENLLDWSLIESGSKAAVPEEVVVKNVVDDVIDLLRSESEAKNIKAINDVADDCEVYADLRMTAGVLRNLLTNGIKFTEEGGWVRVSARKMTNRFTIAEQRLANEEVSRGRLQEFWEISVEDNGIGMEQGEVEQLFRIDRKVYSLGTNDEPGSGYGLILAKQFVESNGGTISVSSEKGKGTVVSFTLPAWGNDK